MWISVKFSPDRNKSDKSNKLGSDVPYGLLIKVRVGAQRNWGLCPKLEGKGNAGCLIENNIWHLHSLSIDESHGKVRKFECR